MPLLKNTNQPYFPDPNSPNSYDCNGEYCYPVNQGDFIYQQWYQTPCGANLVADPTFSNVTYGANLVANGTFTGSLASWTTTGWTYNTNQAQGPIATNPNDLTQAGIASAGVAFYRVTFDVSGIGPDDEIRVSVGGAGYYIFTASGSYDTIIRGTGADLIFKAGIANVSNILLDNVTLQLVTWGDWLTNSAWTINITDGEACANANGTGALIEDVADYITVGEYYSLTFTVDGITAGSVTPYIANMPGTAITANGTYTMYETPTLTGVVSFVPSADFVGCISDVDLRQLRNDYLFEVIRTSDGERYDVSDYISYYEDKVTMASPVLDLLEMLDGCYTIEVTDRCLIEGINLVTNGTFAAGLDDWTRNNGALQYADNAGVMELIFEPLEGADLVTNGNFSSGVGWTIGAGWSIGTGAAVHTPGSTAVLSTTVTIGTPAVAPASLTSWFQFTMTGRTAGSVTITLSDVTSVAYTTNTIITGKLTPTVGGGVVTISINPTSNFDGTIDLFQLYQSPNIWSDYPVIRNTVNTSFVDGNYSLTYDQVSNDRPGEAGMAYGLVGQTQSNVYDTSVATHTNSITNYTPGGQQVYFVGKFTDGAGNYYPGRIGVDNATAVRVEPFEATYTSECLNYQSEHDRTKLITGWCDQESFGFDFVNTGFLLQMRVYCRSLNPVYNKNKNVAQFGTGDAAVKYADSTKYWQLATELLSESAHDALSVMEDCDHFTIGTTGTNDTEYIAEIEDYQPQWIQSGSYSLAPIIINLRLKTGGMKFNRHT